MFYRIIYNNGEAGGRIHDNETLEKVLAIVSNNKVKYPIAILKIKLK